MTDLTGRMIGALRADVKTLNEIEADPNAFTQAIMVILIAGVASLIGSVGLGVAPALLGLVASLLGYMVFSALVFLIGTRFMPEPTTKADFNETFRTVGFAASPGIFRVLAILPIIGYLVSFVVFLWTIVITVVAVREVLDYSSTARAIIVSLIAAAICLVMWVAILLPLWGLLFVTRAALG
jgi:hypothetical protein